MFAFELLNNNLLNVTNFVELAVFGVMSTLDLVVDEKVLSAGKVLKLKKLWSC